MSTVRRRWMWTMALGAVFLATWLAHSGHTALAQHTPGGIYEVSTDIRAVTITAPQLRNGCAKVSQRKNKHSIAGPLGSLAEDGGETTLDSYDVLRSAYVNVHDRKNGLTLQILFSDHGGGQMGTGQFTTAKFLVQVDDTDLPNFTILIPDSADADEDLNNGIQVDVFKNNKKGKSKGSLGQVTIGNPTYTLQPSATGCNYLGEVS